MKFNHNVAHATFFQAAIVIVLSAANAIFTGLNSCLGANKTECAANSILAVVLLVLSIIWFCFLAAIAYVAWIRRTTILILLFIFLEIIVAAAIYIVNIRHPDNLLGQITSIIDFVVTLWVLYMGYHLFKLRGTSSAPSAGRKRSKLNQK